MVLLSGHSADTGPFLNYAQAWGAPNENSENVV